MQVIHLAADSPKPVIKDDVVYLYSMRFCPYAQRAHLVLNAKNIEYVSIFINLSAKPDWYLELFPAGTVPGLHYKREFLHESLLVAEYVNDEFPEVPLSPQTPIQRYKDNLLIQNFGKATTGLYKTAMIEFNEINFTELQSGLREVEKELIQRGTKYLGGNAKPMMVDYMIWGWLERLESLTVLYGQVAKLPEAEFSNLIKYISLMKTDPAVKKHYLTPEQHAKHFTLRKQGDSNVFDAVY